MVDLCSTERRRAMSLRNSSPISSRASSHSLVALRQVLNTLKSTPKSMSHVCITARVAMSKRQVLTHFILFVSAKK